MGGERTWCAAERERWDELLSAFEEREPILTLWRALWAFAVLSGSFSGFERLVWAVLIHCPLHWFPCQIWYHSLMHIFATHIWCTLQPSSICIEVLLKCFPTVKHQVWGLYVKLSGHSNLDTPVQSRVLHTQIFWKFFCMMNFLDLFQPSSYHSEEHDCRISPLQRNSLVPPLVFSR